MLVDVIASPRTFSGERPGTRQTIENVFFLLLQIITTHLLILWQVF